MLICKEYNNFDEIMDMCWSGAIDTLKDIERNNREDEFMNLLEETFLETTPTDTEVNDFIWFDREYIYEHCGLDENGNEPKDYDEEEIENSLEELNETDDFEGKDYKESIKYYELAYKAGDLDAALSVASMKMMNNYHMIDMDGAYPYLKAA